MIPGEEWLQGGQRATPEDLRKYHTQGYRLLVSAEPYCTPFEANVLRFSPNGDFVLIGNGFFGPQIWAPVHGVTVLDVLGVPEPPPEPPELRGPRKKK